jgi:hypothetical protein
MLVDFLGAIFPNLDVPELEVVRHFNHFEVFAQLTGFDLGNKPRKLPQPVAC